MWPFKKAPDRLALITSHLEQVKQITENAIEHITKRCDALNSRIDTTNAEIGYRMSKIEVLFAPELAAKEAERDNKVRESRAKALGNGIS